MEHDSELWAPQQRGYRSSFDGDYSEPVQYGSVIFQSAIIASMVLAAISWALFH